MSRTPEPATGPTEVAIALLVGNSLPDASRCNVSALLQRRVDGAHAGRLGLPSVLRQAGETLEEAAGRAAGAVGVTDPRALEQVETQADEDTGGLVVTYLATVPEIETGLTERFETELSSVAMLHERTTQYGELPVSLIGTHHRALAASLATFAGLIERSPISLSLIPEVFTLGQIRSIYESAWDKRLDVRNFRRKLVEAPQPFLTAVGQTLSSRGTEGRPPELYRATRAWEDGIPVRRPRPRNSR